MISDATRSKTEKVREMLSAGINIQATGETANAVVTGMLQALFSHIDELEADLRSAVALGRAYASEVDRNRGRGETGGAYPPQPSCEPEGSNSSGQSLRSHHGPELKQDDPREKHRARCRAGLIQRLKAVSAGGTYPLDPVERDLALEALEAFASSSLTSKPK